MEENEEFTFEKMTSDEEKFWKENQDNLLVIDERKDFLGTKSIPIPYAFVTGGVNVAGVFYLKEIIEDSYTDGAFVGVVVGSYRLSRKKTETCASNGLIKVCLKLDFNKKALYYRFCHKDWLLRWKCGGWKKVISF